MPDQPETFAELVDSWKLQPWQREFVDHMYGMPVDILPDPFDDKVGYILDKRAMNRQLFIGTPGPDSLYDLLTDWTPRYVHRPITWWQAADLLKATKRMLILDDGPEYTPPDWGRVAMQRFYGTFAD